jgi:hypothetical protein
MRYLLLATLGFATIAYAPPRFVHGVVVDQVGDPIPDDGGKAMAVDRALGRSRFLF